MPTRIKSAHAAIALLEEVIASSRGNCPSLSSAIGVGSLIACQIWGKCLQELQGGFIAETEREDLDELISRGVVPNWNVMIFFVRKIILPLLRSV